MQYDFLALISMSILSEKWFSVSIPCWNGAVRIQNFFSYYVVYVRVEYFHLSYLLSLLIVLLIELRQPDLAVTWTVCVRVCQYFAICWRHCIICALSNSTSVPSRSLWTWVQILMANKRYSTTFLQYFIYWFLLLASFLFFNLIFIHFALGLLLGALVVFLALTSRYFSFWFDLIRTRQTTAIVDVEHSSAKTRRILFKTTKRLTSRRLD